MTETSNDNQLIRQYLKGDQVSLELLIKKYLQPIFGFVFGYVKSEAEAEDIAQETFVRMWKNLKRFDQNKNFKTWLYQIARNASIDHLRKKQAAPLSAFENEVGENILAETVRDQAPLADQLVYQRQLADWLTAAAGKLSPEYQKILTLRYQDYLSFKQIAAALGESVNTVKSRNRRALAALKNVISS